MRKCLKKETIAKVARFPISWETTPLAMVFSARSLKVPSTRVNRTNSEPATSRTIAQNCSHQMSFASLCRATSMHMGSGEQPAHEPSRLCFENRERPQKLARSPEHGRYVVESGVPPPLYMYLRDMPGSRSVHIGRMHCGLCGMPLDIRPRKLPTKNRLLA